MILYCKQNHSCKRQIVVGLPVEEGGVVYVNLGVYRQAILLADRFGNDVRLFNEKMEFPARQVRAYEYFRDHAPSHLAILAPFVQIVDGGEVAPTMDEVCGVLHGISKVINFEAYSKAPKVLRAGTNIRYTDVASYKEEWEELLAQEFFLPENRDIEADRLFHLLQEFQEGLQSKLAEVMANVKFEVKSEPVNININAENRSRYAGMTEEEELGEDYISPNASEEEIEEAFEEDPFAAFNSLFANTLEEAKENGDWGETSEKLDLGEKILPQEQPIELAEEQEVEPEALSPRDKLLALYGGLK